MHRVRILHAAYSKVLILDWMSNGSNAINVVNGEFSHGLIISQ